MASKKSGVCHICGKEGPLSFEHIPPHSMGNSKPTKVYRVADIADTHHTLSIANIDGIRYRQQQRGIGFQTICSSCNSYLGKHCVNAYTGCVTELGAILRESKGDQGCTGIHLEGHNVPVLAFFKHVVSNFCNTTQAGTMLDCREFLLDCKSNAFPERYRVFMFALPEDGSLVSSSWMQLWFDKDGIKTARLAFIAMPPVGFYLYDVESSTAMPEASQYGCEITSMASQPWEARPGFSLDLPYMTVVDLIPVPIVKPAD